MATISDDFNRADASTLGANWSPGYGGTMQLGIASNELYLVGTDSARLAALWNANTFGDAQFAQVRVSALPANSNTWMPLGAVQVQSNGYGYYGLCYSHFPGNSTYSLRLYNTGTLLTTISHELEVGDVVRLEYDGVDTLTVKVNDEVVGAHTISSSPRTGYGYVGLFSYSMPSGDTWRLDDFSGGDLEVPSPPDAPTIGAVTNVTHNAATINWTDNSDDEDGFKVEYGESSGGTVSSWSEASNSPAAADAESLNITGLDPETTYKARVAATNEHGDSSFVETAEFTTDPTPDTTPPTLSNPTAAATGQTTASGSVTTDEAGGLLYYLASANSTESAATVKGGSSQAVSATGVQNVSFTGLTANTPYYPHYVHVDAADNESNVASGSQFTTDSPPPPGTKGIEVQLSGESANLTNVSARWWDDPDAAGAPDFETDVAATDATGKLKLNLDAVTSNEIGAHGRLLVFKEGLTPADDFEAGGRVPVQEITE